MKSLFISIGAYSTALANVFQMNNFNPTTLIFWTTITGIFIWSVIGGLVGLLFFDVIGKFKNKWIGIGQIHSKG